MKKVNCRSFTRNGGSTRESASPTIPRYHALGVLYVMAIARTYADAKVEYVK